MARYSDQVSDEFGRPVPGATIYVYDLDVSTSPPVVIGLSALTDDLAIALGNPVVSDEFGDFYFNTAAGRKMLEIHFGGQLRWKESVVVGPDSIGDVVEYANAAGASATAADASADAAALSATAAATFASASGSSASSASASSTQAGVYAAAAAALASRIYASTGAGIAATVNGNYFWVISGSTLALYLNSAGSAVSQNYSMPSAAALPAIRAATARLSGAGTYENMLAGLTPTITILGGGAGAATLSDTADGLSVTGATFNQQIALTTDIKAGAAYSCFTATIKITNAPGTTRAGLVFTSGGNYTAVSWQNNGWLDIRSAGGGPSGTPFYSALPTYATGDTLTMSFLLTADGKLYLVCQKGTGKRIAFGFAGVPVSDVGLTMFDDTTAAVVAFKITEKVVQYTAPATVAQDATVADFLAPYALTMPAAFVGASRLPQWAKFYTRTDSRLFITTFNLQPVLDEADPTVFVQYVDIATGNDANAGTFAAPVKSIKEAFNRAQSGTRAIVKGKGGTYGSLNNATGGAQAAAIMQLTSWDGNRVISSTHLTGLVWTLVSAGTYSAPFTGMIGTAFDAAHLDANGHYTIIALAASQAACQATAGTYFVSGGTVYVQPSDGRAPDANIRLFLTGANLQWHAPGSTLYMENWGNEGGDYAFAALPNDITTAQTIYGRNCTFKYASSSGAEVHGDTLTVWQECVAARNTLDGFHYGNAIISMTKGNALAIEVDCIAQGNGLDGAAQDNSSSSHGIPIIQVKTKAGYGVYKDAAGRGIHHILETQPMMAWLMGVDVSNSGGGEANIALDGSGSKMWLHNVTSSGAAFDINARTAGSNVYTYGFVGSATNTGPGTITTYTP
jgi:hypothetical protein